MKEYKFVKVSEGMKRVVVSGKAMEDNILTLIDNYAQEGWDVFQFIHDGLGAVLRIVFVRDKR